MTRIIRTPGRIFRVCSKICSLAFLLGISFVILNITVAHAIETTKATGLVPGHIHAKGQASNSSLSSSQNSCRKYLSSNYVPPKHGHDAGVNGRATVPVALGIFLGMRIALIPSSASGKSQKSRNVQIGPEIRTSSLNGNRHALAVAAFRKCQKEEFLKAGYNNK